MPNHRKKEKLPRELLERIRTSPEHPVFGKIHIVRGGGLRNSVRSLVGRPRDTYYSSDGHILTRVEFLRGEPAIPLHIANFDASSGKRLGICYDSF